MLQRRTATALVFLLAGAAAPAAAQIHITPAVGAFHPDRSPFALDYEGESHRHLIRGRTLGLGLNLEAGIFRGTIAYATNAKILRDGFAAEGPVGEGQLLAVLGGLTLRPIPRFGGLQPYGIAGAGVKRFGYSWDEDGISNAFPSDQTDFALQAGLGLDMMLGAFGLTAEVSDMISVRSNVRHDTFLMLGMRLRLGQGR
jgi:opacity protein-like surface antigen